MRAASEKVRGTGAARGVAPAPRLRSRSSPPLPLLRRYCSQCACTHSFERCVDHIDESQSNDEMQTITTSAHAVQSVTTSATEIHEIQTVSLAATHVDEVQTVRLDADPTVEVQQLELQDSHEVANLNGSYRLRFDSRACDLCVTKSDERSVLLDPQLQDTATMSVALETMPNVGDVSVSFAVRMSGTSQHSADAIDGYVWSITFALQGDVPQLSIVDNELASISHLCVGKERGERGVVRAGAALAVRAVQCSNHPPYPRRAGPSAGTTAATSNAPW